MGVGRSLWVVDHWLLGRVDWLGWVCCLGLVGSGGLDWVCRLVWLAAGGSGALALSLGDDGLDLGVDDCDDLLLDGKVGRVDLRGLGLGDDGAGEGVGARLALNGGHDVGLDGLVGDGLGLADGGDLEGIVWNGLGLGHRLDVDVGCWDELGDGDLGVDVLGLGHGLGDGLDDGGGGLRWNIGGDGLVDGLAGAADLAVLLWLVRGVLMTALAVAVVVRERGSKTGNGEESNCELHDVDLGCLKRMW